LPGAQALLACIVATTLVFHGAAKADAATCGELNITSFGPYDYRTDRALYKVVVDHHFTPDIEVLRLRADGLPPGGDLSYTLRSIPNHHRALVAVTNYGKRWGDQRLQFPVACYFDRAIRFRPDDTVVRGLYATYLISKNMRKEAIQQLDVAVHFAGDNAFSHYNIGLIYLELEQFDKAAAQAHRAKALGFPGDMLETRLKQLGKWQDHASSAPTN
jgi:tetratricopeptide (TPR) repeat protein